MRCRTRRPSHRGDRRAGRLHTAAGETVKSGCLVVDPDGRVLLLTDAARTRYLLPKGHVERGEGRRVAARRETLEEAGLVVDLGDRLGDVRYRRRKSGERVRLTLYLARPRGAPGEGEFEVVWVPVDEALVLVAPEVGAWLRERLGLDEPPAVAV